MRKSLTAKKRESRPLRVLEATSRIMVRYGFDKTTMQDIAREAGVSKGALYLEWSSKEDLFEALIIHEMRVLLLELRARLADQQDCSLAQLYALTLECMQRSPLICALYTRDTSILGDFIHHQDPDRYVRRLLLSQENVRSMQQAGLLRTDLSAEVISHLFMLNAIGLLSINNVIPTEKSPPLAETIQGIAAMVQSGLTLPAQASTGFKEAAITMLDLMLAQYKENHHEN